MTPITVGWVLCPLAWAEERIAGCPGTGEGQRLEGSAQAGLAVTEGLPRGQTTGAEHVLLPSL